VKHDMGIVSDTLDFGMDSARSRRSGTCLIWVDLDQVVDTQLREETSVLGTRLIVGSSAWI
jgi:hypothetical protein